MSRPFYNGGCLHWACDNCPSVETSTDADRRRFETFEGIFTPPGAQEKRRGRRATRKRIGRPVVCRICECSYCIEEAEEKGVLAPCQYPNGRALRQHFQTHGLTEMEVETGPWEGAGACKEHIEQFIAEIAYDGDPWDDDFDDEFGDDDEA